MRTITTQASLACLIFAMVGILPTKADVYTMTLEQDGSDVVATGSGDINLDGLTLAASGAAVTGIAASEGFININPITDSNPDSDQYGGISGPSSFGSGGLTHATSGTGDETGVAGYDIIFVPVDYTSGTPLSGSITFSDTTLADLGVTPGTYTWTWGTTDENSFVLDVVASAPVPEPSQWGLFAMLGAVIFVGVRRYRSVPSIG